MKQSPESKNLWALFIIFVKTKYESINLRY